MVKRIPWSRQELLAAFRLYCRTPFGQLHQTNQDVIELARVLGRTPAAVSMKACNFASFDPAHRKRGVAGLRHASRADRDLWREFEENAEKIAVEAEAACASLSLCEGEEADGDGLVIPDGPTEVLGAARIRRVQGFFRDAVMVSYDYRCALSGIAFPQLLNASHIIPWRDSIERRADPRNGIALNALYDRAFDRGLITFDEEMRLVVSSRLKSKNPPTLQRQALLEVEGTRLRPAQRFAPDPVALAYHRERIFA
ncbi:MAG: HNH endonuclease [Lentisphaerae bacterium]|nr:HNH endonuclease [Lentisphaerota bacterium]